MSEETRKAIHEAVQNNHELRDQLLSAASAEDVVKILVEVGLVAFDEDLTDLVDSPFAMGDLDSQEFFAYATAICP
jgi:hypothetical protein